MPEASVLRLAFAATGVVALALGFVGLFLPLLPTVPFVLLAAFCFARSNPRWERALMEHHRFGPHIRAWRERGAISSKGKAAATAAFAISAIVGLVWLDTPWSFLPLLIALIGGTWVLTRPSA
jgi:uncharacterized membrane protein YbaN (DUF454 family)